MIVPLSEIIEALESGVSVNSDDMPAEKGARGVLKVGCVADGRFYPNENKRILPSEADRVSISVSTGDLLVTRANTFELIGACGIVDGDYPNLYLPDKVWRVVLRDPVRDSILWLNQVLNSPGVRTELKKRATGTSGSMKNIPQASFLTIPVFRHSTREQIAIAALLDCWDRGIRHLSDLIAAKVLTREGLVQRLLNGSLRFRGYSKNALEGVPLQNVLLKVSDAVVPGAQEMYREIGIRSHGKGIFHKEPVSGESLGNKRVFRVVPGCLTFNIVFAWERALAITTDHEDGMIASHRFPMFRPDATRLLAEYALLYLLSKKGAEALDLASPGGAGRNRTLSQTAFLKNLIPLPSVPEQRKIVELVKTVDHEIELLRKQLNALKQQKRGLMQKLLTGKVRVGENSNG